MTKLSDIKQYPLGQRFPHSWPLLPGRCCWWRRWRRTLMTSRQPVTKPSTRIFFFLGGGCDCYKLLSQILAKLHKPLLSVSFLLLLLVAESHVLSSKYLTNVWVSGATCLHELCINIFARLSQMLLCWSDARRGFRQGAYDNELPSGFLLGKLIISRLLMYIRKRRCLQTQGITL